MKQSYRLIVVSFFLISTIYSQNEKVLTKMDRFVSNTGKIIKIENFNLLLLNAYNELLEAKVRRETIQNETSYFLLLVNEKDKTAAIAEDDLDELIKAFNELILQSENETTTANYYVNKFTTEDGFQIGYSGSSNLLWFITLEMSGSSTILFNEYESIQKIFELAQKKIAILKTE